MAKTKGFKWTSVRLTSDQRKYIERRASQRAAEIGVQVGLVDVISEAIDLLREHKPVSNDAKVEAA